jgi:UDP-N-acetyl-D-glucosamine/UDP-N-acetyl-D-galactosamine dehydrogenase
MGATFKENVTDIRNSKVIDIVRELKAYSLTVHLVDPYASSEEYVEEYGQEIQPHADKDYDAVVVAVSHREYQKLDEEYFLSIAKKDALLYDLKGIYKNRVKILKYMSL